MHRLFCLDAIDFNPEQLSFELSVYSEHVSVIDVLALQPHACKRSHMACHDAQRCACQA
jgi:hypothetical protein